MTDDERFRLDVAKVRFLDRKKVVQETVSAVMTYFPEGISLAEIEAILSDTREELSGGMITYASPLDMAEDNAVMAERYRERMEFL